MIEKSLDFVANRIVLFIKKHTTVSLLILVLFATLFLALLPYRNSEIQFNQTLIEKVDREFGSCYLCVAFKSVRTNYSSRINGFFNFAQRSEVNLSDIDSLLTYVWSQLPYYATVYPTEMYYYYQIPSVKISGNLRFTDIKNGKLSFAFFNTDNAQGFDSGKGYKIFDDEDGLKVETVSGNIYRLTYKNKTVVFELPIIQNDRPENLKILPEEEIVSKVRDESGVLLYLFFNNKTASFYFVLDEEKGVKEPMIEIESDILINERTHFTFYVDRNFDRKILIGVDTENVWKNNYFDGPFDQVPPNLDIREKLYKAYPYTQYLNGLDANGNFLDFEGSRVAISPYTDYYYPDTSLIEQLVEECGEKKDDPSLLWSCLTYETKKDFHKTVPEYFYEDGRKK